MSNLALENLMKPGKNMELALRHETKDEGFSPGLRLFPGNTPNQSILLNATYNNYTITNHYRSKEQFETNAALKKELAECRRKYDAAKTLLRQADVLIDHLNEEDLDMETWLLLANFRAKWERVSGKKRKVDSEDTLSSKKTRLDINKK